jgi:putative ABC transport system substrate-binding protein
MNRREFITLFSGAAATWPLAARAQQLDRMPLIGILQPVIETDAEGRARVAAFAQQLEELGWIEGRNVRFEYRWAGRDPGRQQVAAKELVRLEPNMIVTNSTPATQVLQNETNTIPILFAGATDPLASGLVKSLAHPGGNVTGFTNFEFSVGGKWLELLKQIAPGVDRVLVLMQSGNDGNLGLWHAIEGAAAAFSVRVSRVDLNATAALEGEVERFAREPNGGLIVLPTPTGPMRDLVIALADRNHLPAIHSQRSFAVVGGLLSYGYDELMQWRGAATYANRILRGEKPANLPVQQPTKFDFVINLRTAKALGLTVPLSLQVAADEVIE